VTAGLGGSVARVLVRDDWLASTDPVVAARFVPGLMQFDYATCAKLLNYPDAPGAAGRKLVPEVAAAWPTVSDGGRTYTFPIRPGYRFSPPSNEPVTAETFRHVIERALSPALGEHAPGAKALPDIVGAAAYRAGRAARVAGLAVRGSSLVIHLLRPAPDLPLRLALPYFCAVPRDTPAIANGVPVPLASAGPYYLAARSGDVAALKRNPNYGGPRPHRLDAIVYEIGVGSGDASRRVAQGKADYVSEFDLRSARLTRYPGTSFLALDPSRPPFRDARLRRAVAYAVDRRVLAAAAPVPALPAEHVLSPELAGFRGPPIYRLHADRGAARTLAGRRLKATLAGCNHDPHCEPLVAEIRRELAAIGVSVTELPGKPSRADILLASTDWGPYDAVQELESLPNLPAPYAARLARIARLPSPARETLAGALALRLDRDAVYVTYADGAIPELASARLGCRLHATAYPGLDLAALCLR
jgi:ABC-type transport system substrate-binding protein